MAAGCTSKECNVVSCRRDFYGPLLACVSATKSAFNAMVRQHSVDGKGDTKSFHQACLRDPEGPQATAYRYVQGRLG